MARLLQVAGTSVASACGVRWLTRCRAQVIEKAERESLLNELWTTIGASEVTRLVFSSILDNQMTKCVSLLLVARCC